MAAVREQANEARMRLRHGRGSYRRERLRTFGQHVEFADDTIVVPDSQPVADDCRDAVSGKAVEGVSVISGSDAAQVLQAAEMLSMALPCR